VAAMVEAKASRAGWEDFLLDLVVMGCYLSYFVKLDAAIEE
jgi:hypothetical protein